MSQIKRKSEFPYHLVAELLDKGLRSWYNKKLPVHSGSSVFYRRNHLDFLTLYIKFLLFKLDEFKRKII
ncbi:MAG: hypothetical protein B6244_14000 [Candidatus Cloacimonetes bacterium 4572_55]|nr:MAG: hypothetical protein B6244_14000 [Candidatus Cloacimonetes bacterium 4572_55]